MTNQHIPGRADIEFATEPVLSGIRKGGPADGKLEEQDVVVAVDGQLITTQAGAVRYSWIEPGKPVRLTVRRAGVLKDVEIVPAARCRPITIASDAAAWPVRGGLRGFVVMPALASRGWFGIGLSCASCGLVMRGPLMSFGSYPEVSEVAPGSPADKAGLKAGDLLVAMDGLSLKSLDGTNAFRTVKPNQKVALLVVRDADVVRITLTAGPPR